MTDKILLTDLDDTVLEWNSAFLPFLEDLGYVRYDRVTDSFLYEHMYDLSSQEINKLIEDFQHSCFFENLSPSNNAQEILPKFKEMGYKIVGISAAANTAISLKNRWLNISVHFPNTFDEIYHTSGSENKRPYLGRFKKAVWVEDNHFCAIEGVNQGHDTYLITKPHNQKSISNKFRRVNCWRDIWGHLHA